MHSLQDDMQVPRPIGDGSFSRLASDSYPVVFRSQVVASMYTNSLADTACGETR